MLQCQGSVRDAQESLPHLKMDPASKWWHVPDGQIENLIRQLNTEQSSQANHDAELKASAPKGVYGSSLRQPGRFSTNYTVPFDAAAPEEDSLDQALRQDNEASRRSVSSMKNGAWKVSDQAMLEFLKKRAGLNEIEEEEEDEEGDEKVEAKGAKSAQTLMKSVLGNNEGCLRSTLRDEGALQQGAAVYSQKGHERQVQKGQKSAHGVVGRKGSSKTYLNPCKWDKCLSMPTLFANVGSGLDGKGNKVIKGAKFANTPIFLQDAQDHHFERVRVAVCGHRYYNPF